MSDPASGEWTAEDLEHQIASLAVTAREGLNAGAVEVASLSGEDGALIRAGYSLALEKLEEICRLCRGETPDLEPDEDPLQSGPADSGRSLCLETR